MALPDLQSQALREVLPAELAAGSWEGMLRAPRRACSDPFRQNLVNESWGLEESCCRSRSPFCFLYLKGQNQSFVCFVMVAVVILKARLLLSKRAKD